MRVSEEDYLKLIYKLLNESKLKAIKTSDLKDNLGYSVQSIIEMIKKMEKRGLVKYIPYKGITLTKRGESAAIKLLKAHSLWEVFLVEKLQINWANAHEEAEKLEHATSSQVLELLDNFLDNPKYCPHGKLIAGHEKSPSEKVLVSLNDVNEGDELIIRRVMDIPDLLKFLNRYKLKLGSNIKVLERDDFNQNVKVFNNDSIIDISYKVAKMIFMGV